MQKFSPGCFLIALLDETSEGLSHNFISAADIHASDAGEHLQFGNPAEQRGDQRLNRHQRAIAGLRITPGLEVMRNRQVPVAPGEGFVFIMAEANDHFRFALSVDPIQINRRGVSRVAAQHDQCLDLPGIERFRQIHDAALFEIGHLVENDCFAYVVQCGIQGVGEQMNGQRLAMAG